MTLRIVHAVVSDRFAGVERFVLRLALAQAAAGHDVRVTGGDPGRMASELRPAGVPFTPGKAPLSVLRALRSAEVDVVNTHMTAADGAAALAFALPGGPRRPALVSTRHFAAPRGGIGPLRWDALIAPRMDAEISISGAVASSTGLPSTIVHTGVPDVVTAATERPRRVLMAQRLQPEKRTDLGVRAFAESGLAADGWTLCIAGDGPDRVALTRLSQRLGVDSSVRMLGFRADVPTLLDEAALFLATCPREGLGIAVLEAMAQGVPVIAAGAAGHLDLLEGLDARALFTPDDPAAAASALRTFAGDSSGRAALASAQQLRQRERFSMAAQVAGTDAVYRAALARSAT